MPRAAKQMPGVLGVFTGADCAADKLKPIPHDPLPKTKFDMKLTGPGGGAVFIGPHVLLPADKARHVGEAVAMVVAETKAQAMDAAEAVEVRYEELPFVLHSEDAMRPGAPALWDEVPNNVTVDTHLRQCRGDRPGLRARGPCRDQRTSMSAASPACRSNRARRSATTMPRPAATRSMPAPAARCGRSTSSPPCSAFRPTAARPLARRRRQFRHAQSRVRRIRPGAVGVAQDRPAGEIHRHPLGSVSQRLSGPRSRDQGRTGARRQRPLSRHARDQYQQCRRALRVAVAAEQGRGAYSRLLRDSGDDAARHGRVHQHHADPGLSQLRPAGSHLCDRAAGRCRRRSSSASTASSCGARTSLRPAAMPYRNSVGMLYDSGRYEENMDWAMDIADWKGFPARRREAARRGKLLGLGLANYVESSIGAPREQARITVQPQKGRPCRCGHRHAAGRAGPRNQFRPGGLRPASRAG